MESSASVHLRASPFTAWRECDCRGLPGDRRDVSLHPAVGVVNVPSVTRFTCGVLRLGGRINLVIADKGASVEHRGRTSWRAMVRSDHPRWHAQSVPPPRCSSGSHPKTAIRGPRPPAFRVRRWVLPFAHLRPASPPFPWLGRYRSWVVSGGSHRKRVGAASRRPVPRNAQHPRSVAQPNHPGRLQVLVRQLWCPCQTLQMRESFRREGAPYGWRACAAPIPDPKGYVPQTGTARRETTSLARLQCICPLS